MANVHIDKKSYTVDSLYQWDINQELVIYGLSLATIPEIHYTNDAMDKAIVRQATMDNAGVIRAEIPNSLLQKPYKIRAYVCIYEGDTFKSLYLITIPINARSMPTDYTITVSDDEVYSFNALENKLENTLAVSLARYEEVNEKYEDALDGLNSVKDYVALGKGYFENAQTSAKNASTSEVNANASANSARNAQTKAESARDKALEYMGVAEDAMEKAVNAKKAIDTAIDTYGQLNPLFANSIDECTDTNMLYVLPDGFIYAYTDKEVTTLATNKLDRAKISLNTRYSGSPGSAVTANGHYTSDFIPVDMSLADPLVMRISPASAIKAPNGGCKIILIGADKVTLQQTYLFNNSTQNTASTVHNAITSDGDYLIDIGYVRTGTNTPTKCANYDSIKYIRITDELDSSSITLDNVPEYTITFDAENKTEHITGWANTGHAFVPADYENRIYNVENDVAAIKNRILKYENGTGGITGSTEITVPTYWQSAVDSCIAKIKALQVGRHCITFPFFSDNHTNTKDLGVLIAKVMKECSIPYCLFGGDAIDSGYLTESQMIGQDKAFDTVLSQIPNGRFCRAVGNHDGFWNDNGAKGYYTRAQVYELFLRDEGTAQNKHFGEDGTYYYVDDIASKVRFIVLNTNSETISAGSESIDSTQLLWLQNTALSFNESGWGVVIISHCPISNHYHANVTNATEVIATVNNSNVDVIGWFSGHIHRDRMYTHSAVGSTDGVEGTNGDPLGFTQIVITSDHTSIAYDDSTKHAVADDDLSHAIDFVTVNKDTRTVNITRLGIGNDRSYTY